MAYIATTKCPDVDENTTNYCDAYFKDMIHTANLCGDTIFTPKLLSLSLGHGALTLNSNGYVLPSLNNYIKIPHRQFSEVSSRLGHLELVSTDISVFQPNAETLWRRIFKDMINLHTLVIQCYPSELNDFQTLVDIFLRSPDLPSLRSLTIVGPKPGPIPIDSKALLNFLSYHQDLEMLGLLNVLPMEEDGAGGLARNVLSTVHELRQHAGLRGVGFIVAPYEGGFHSGKECQKPEQYGVVNKCFCRECVSEALQWLNKGMDVPIEAGGYQYADLVWTGPMPDLKGEEEEME